MDDAAMPRAKLFPRFRWPNSLQIKLTAGFIATALLSMVIVVSVLQTDLRVRLEQEKLQLVAASGNQIIAELSQRAAVANAVAQSIAHFAETAPRDEALFKQIIPSLLKTSTGLNLIAGGGFWPEAYSFDPTRERRSFFWGLGSDGKFRYFDDYNDPAGTGYHREEWYVPARLQRLNKCYWSRSYTDPYSGEAMVTCSVAVSQADKFQGVSTVDMRLTGLHQLLEREARRLGGYAFVVDQHNQFITYPDMASVQRQEGGQIKAMLDVLALKKKEPLFSPLADALLGLEQRVITEAGRRSNDISQQAKELENHSYQINAQQAAMIASALVDPWENQPDGKHPLITLSLDNDPLLKEAATASIFHMPDAYWKVVLVTPKRQDFASVQALIKGALLNLLLPLTLLTILSYLVLRAMIIHPLKNMTRLLKASSMAPDEDGPLLDENRSDELGQLAYWYNRRTRLLADAMQRLSSNNKELSFHASCDALTGLTNRRSFEHHLDQLVDREDWSEHALLYIDIDQFKVINDTCGHLAGDELLKNIALQMQKTSRQSDLLARLGGDEFAMLIRIPSHREAQQFAERVRQAIERNPFTWQKEKRFNVSASIGVVHLGDIPQDKATALRYVDNACYAAKDGGRNQVQIYLPGDEHLAQREGEMNWLSSIQAAMDEQRFFLEYQSIQGLTHRESGATFEALLRMRDHNGQVIPPGAFLPAAERYGAISKIDRWVIADTMHTLAELVKKGFTINFCSINLSGATIGQDSLLDYVKEQQAITGIDPKRICFEITETAVISNLSRARESLQALREMGFLIALDDFGAGMSSYAYLRELPVDLLKIDGRFVRDAHCDPIHRAFVESIHSIGKVMGLRTIAEFVEDAEALTMLQEIGVDFAQGYHLGRPGTIESQFKNHASAVKTTTALA